MVHSNYFYVKENLPGREFQESHENISAAFKRKVAGTESHEDSKWSSKLL